MSAELELQNKLRRSEVLTQNDIYKDFMSYAGQVRDELDIFVYMEENDIGITETEYWLARFKAMRNRCEFVDLVKLIYYVKFVEGIDEQKILRYQKKLRDELEGVIMSDSHRKGKRRVTPLRPSNDNIYKAKRKIGNIEVYIQREARKNYELDDFARYVEDNMKQFCQLERNCYLRSQSYKPPSFLAKKQQHLLKLAQELLSKNIRKSGINRNSLGTIRPSAENKWTFINRLSENNFNTPNNNNESLTKPSQRDKTKLKEKIEHDRSRDSVEILRQLNEKRQIDNYRSPTFKCQGQLFETDNEQLGLSFEICRGNAEDETVSIFSFGKRRQSQQQSPFFQRARNHQDDPEDNEEDRKDDAFIVFSFSKEVSTLTLIDKKIETEKKVDEEFQGLLEECQKQKYDKKDTRTFSSIDSNQQNTDYQDSLNLPEFSNIDRKPFEVLFEVDSHHFVQLSSISKTKINEDPDEKNPESCDFIERELYSLTEQKPKKSKQIVFRSERKLRSHSKEQKDDNNRRKLRKNEL